MNVILGVDVGATTIAAGLVTRAGDVVHSAQRPTHAEGAGTAVKTMLQLIEEQLAEAERRGARVEGVGVGLPGVVDPANGSMLVAPANGVPEFHHVPITEEVRRVTNLPAFVENDGNALALGEWTFGAARGMHSLVLFALGTDVGGGIIVKDEIFRGAHGYGAELHSLTVKFDGEPCHCGARGCLGAYVAGRAIAAAARRQLASGAPSALAALAGGDPAAVTAAHVFDAAARGDAVADAIVRRACAALGAGIATMVGSLDPELVVVTGGVAQSLVPLVDEVLRAAAAHTLPPALPHTRIRVTAGTKRDTVRGGAAVVLYHQARNRAAR